MEIPKEEYIIKINKISQNLASVIEKELNKIVLEQQNITIVKVVVIETITWMLGNLLGNCNKITELKAIIGDIVVDGILSGASMMNLIDAKCESEH